MSNFLGPNIKMLRKKADVSQAALGLAIGKGQKTIGNWETGFSEPNTDELIKLSKYFGVSIDDLLTTEIEDVHLIEKKAKGKNPQNVHLNVHGNVHPKAKNYELPAYQAAEDRADIKNPPESDLFWRDKYIKLLEMQLPADPIGRVDAETLQDVQSSLAALREFVLQLASGGISGANGPIPAYNEAATILDRIDVGLRGQEGGQKQLKGTQIAGHT